MSDPFIGEVRIFANSYVPDGWVLCDGRALSVANYQPLYAVLRGAYGYSAQQNTFNVPNLNGRVAIGSGQASAGAGITNYVVAQTDGVEGVVIDWAHTPPHTHQLQKKNTSAAGAAGKTAVPSAVSDLGGLSTSASVSYNAVIPNGGPNTTLAPSTLGAVAGGTTAHENRQPYLALYFAIAYTGVYPVQP